MGAIGNFGNYIVFETSDKKILTFSNMTQNVSGKYAKHSIIGQKDRAEFIGAGNRSVSFKILLDISLGIRPIDILQKIEEAVENGAVDYLVIGGKMIGKNKFYISTISESMDVIMSKGEIARVTLTINMEEYL